MKNKKTIFFVYSIILATIIGFKLYIDNKKNIELKQLIVKEESQSLAALTMSLRETYQNAFIDNKLDINEKTINLLPVRTAPDIADKFSNLLNNKTTIRTVSDRPRNKKNKANEYEMKIISYFNQNPDSSFYFKDADSSYFYAVPLRIKKSCLECHGKKDEVLQIIQDQYNTAYDYKVGELRGIISINTEKKELFETIIAKQESSLLSAIIIFIIFIIAGFITYKILTKNDKEFTKKLELEVEEKTKELKTEIENSSALNEELNQNIEELTTIKENIEKQKKIIEESEQKFKTIFQSSFAGISILTKEGIHIDVNPNCEKIHGYKKEELIGEPFNKFSLPEDIKLSRNAVAELLLENKEKVEIDIRLLHKKSNKIIWIHAILTKYKQSEKDTDPKILVVFHNITKLKQIEQELKESEEKYQNIINLANDAIILVDNNEKIILWNNVSENIFGYSKDEIFEKNVHEILPPLKYRDKAHNAFSLFRKSGKGDAINRTIELEGLRKNGTEFPVELSLSAFKMNNLWYAVGIIRDISMRKEYEYELQNLNNQLVASEEELKKQNEILYQKNEEIKLQREKVEEVVRQFEDTMENLEDVYFKTDRKFIYKYVSPSIKDHLEINSFNQVIGKPLTEFWLVDKSYLKKLTIKILKEARIKDLLFKYKTINDDIKYAKINARALFINNKFVGIEGLIRDVTKDIEYQSKINELNNQKEVLINNIPSAIFYKDKDLRYVELNNHFANLLGKPINEIIGKTDIELSNDSEAETYKEIDIEVIKSKKPKYNIVKEYKLTDGAKQWISTSKIPYLDANNNVAGIIGVVRDITDQIEYEKALEESKDKIEKAHKDITDNINYAKTIQQALLPSEDIISGYLSQYFVFFKPKEQVSGDFYFFKKFNEYVIFSAADCTGHGVSGGFLTMLGITNLNDIVSKRNINNPAKALNLLRDKIKSTYKLFGSENKDGLDIALCALNTKTNELIYSGAFNPLWIVRDNELIEYKATRNPIGFYINEIEFTSHKIQLKTNDTIYIFSDGFVDQFGGKNNKKYTAKRFKQFLIKINELPLTEQKEKISVEFNNWKGNNEQVDDVVIIGVKV